MSMIPSYSQSYASGPRHLRPDDDSPPSFMPPYQSGTPEEEEELALLQQLERGGEAFHTDPPAQMGRQAIDHLGELRGQDELPQIEEQDAAAGLLEPAIKPSRSARAAWFRDQLYNAATVEPGNDAVLQDLAQGQDQNQIPRTPHPGLEDFEAMPKSHLLKEAVPGQPSPPSKPESGPQMEEDVAGSGLTSSGSKAAPWQMAPASEATPRSSSRPGGASSPEGAAAVEEGVSQQAPPPCCVQAKPNIIGYGSRSSRIYCGKS